MRERTECVTMLLAFEDSRLGLLTKNRAKAELFFGGNCRLIDFTLANCICSGLSLIGILSSKEQAFLHSSYPSSGVHVLPCGETIDSRHFGFFEGYHPEYVLFLSCDQIYQMDFSKLIAFHKQKNAACTVVTCPVPPEKASEYCILSIIQDGFVTKLEEKPIRPKSTWSLSGIFLFDWKKLRKYFALDYKSNLAVGGFEKRMLQLFLSAGEKVAAYFFNGYYREISTAESLWTANMELLKSYEKFKLLDRKELFFSSKMESVPSFFGENAKAYQSVVSDGCVIDGTISSSLLSSGVTVSKDAVVKNSVIFPGTIIGGNTVISHAVIGENVFIGDNAIVGNDKTFESNLTVVGDRIQIGKNTEVCGEIDRDIPEGIP